MLDPGRTVREVCDRIREIRIAKGLTQEQAAERLGVSPRAYQFIECGQNLTIKSLARIANVLDALPAEFFTLPAKRETHRGRPRKLRAAS